MDLRSTSQTSNYQTSDFVSKSVQATLFRNVYLWMTLALILTAITAVLVANSPNMIGAILANNILFYGLLIGELAIVFILSARINKFSFQTATLLFVLYSVLNGVTMSIIFIAFTAESIGLTFFVTAGTFGAMALFGTITKKDLSSWGNILFMALIGLIIASVANWFLKSETFYWIVTYAGVLIFVGLTAYDAQKIKVMIRQHGHEINETTQKLALMGALSLYLDFINLFLYLLRIFGRRN
ncbi:BAX inhibitor (BI)-1/YccA family protein [Dysgonomonas sp. 216]|uniref:Bax inhibitor-1/YccA family protein n=1 Tax=Dysgonomonas sp. 216 TaxID=2302934 RepID=UPI0013D0824C|nr:Bax inhibitor-1/YccA family protein [Dysgonomonas sp. 216]NDW17604.1 BAX inhibitor (BI)-1/YccA family protein [Dysgonomonas sp. 216]